jgi:phage shock protein C
VTVQASSIEGLRQMVSLGIGCTFLPKLATIGPFARTAPTAIRPLAEPRPSRALILLWRRTHPRTGELRELARTLREGLLPSRSSGRWPWRSDAEDGGRMPEDWRRLRRSRTNRQIAGVLGGLAEYFGVDPTLLRVIYVVGSIVSAAFPGLLVYLLLWLIIPEAEG